jgi:hypothetical protein
MEGILGDRGRRSTKALTKIVIREAGYFEGTGISVEMHKIWGVSSDRQIHRLLASINTPSFSKVSDRDDNAGRSQFPTTGWFQTRPCSTNRFMARDKEGKAGRSCIYAVCITLNASALPKRFAVTKKLLVGSYGIPLEGFFSVPVKEWFR